MVQCCRAFAFECKCKWRIFHAKFLRASKHLNISRWQAEFPYKNRKKGCYCKQKKENTLRIMGVIVNKRRKICSESRGVIVNKRRNNMLFAIVPNTEVVQKRFFSRSINTKSAQTTLCTTDGKNMTITP